MATLRSLYSAAISANVPNDLLPPEPPSLGTIQAQQNTNAGAVPAGRTKIILNWTAPTLNVLVAGEYLADATGDAQDLETIYDDIASSPTPKVYEVTGYSGGSTTLSAAAALGATVISVTATTDFTADDWIELDDGTDTEYVQILSVGSGVLNLKNGLRRKSSWPQTTTTVKECTATLKTVTTHYTITLATGAISLVDDAFTAGNPVFIQYQTELNDLAGFVLYRIPGNLPVADGAPLSDVTGHGSVETVSTAIGSGTTSYEDQLTDAYNGETWSYYLAAKDDEASPNYSVVAAVMVETIPTIPQSLGKTVGDSQVVITWTPVTDDNADGYNIYRDDGGTFEDATCKKVNSAVIAKATGSFDDSAGNVTNRRSSGDVPYPVNGSTYSYKVEAEDTSTAWTTGPRNLDAEGGAAVTTAEKTA